MTENTGLKIVTSEEYAEANYALPKIEALVIALENIDRQTVSGNIHAFAEVQSFKSRLIPIFNNHKEIVAQGEEQYAIRDKELLSKATQRIIDIPAAINFLESKFEHKIRAHEHKVNALRKQSLSPAEIAHVCKPISESEHEELAVQIQSLKNEKASLFDFINDAPCFDIELLKNTSIYPESLKTA